MSSNHIMTLKAKYRCLNYFPPHFTQILYPTRPRLSQLSLFPSPRYICLQAQQSHKSGLPRDTFETKRSRQLQRFLSLPVHFGKSFEAVNYAPDLLSLISDTSVTRTDSPRNIFPMHVLCPGRRSDRCIFCHGNMIHPPLRSQNDDRTSK